jgi:hypothetical protein
MKEQEIETKMFQREEDLKNQPESILTTTTSDEVTTISVNEIPVSELTEREVMEKYLSDPDVQKNLKRAASDFQSRFRETWFTLSQVTKKTNYKDVKQANHILQVLTLADYAGVRADRGMVEYRIVLDKKDKAEIIQLDIDHLDKTYKERREFLVNEEKKYQ